LRLRSPEKIFLGLGNSDPLKSVTQGRIPSEDEQSSFWDVGTRDPGASRPGTA
jgi:hypothetical protein